MADRNTSHASADGRWSSTTCRRRHCFRVAARTRPTTYETQRTTASSRPLGSPEHRDNIMGTWVDMSVGAYQAPDGRKLYSSCSRSVRSGCATPTRCLRLWTPVPAPVATPARCRDRSRPRPNPTAATSATPSQARLESSPSAIRRPAQRSPPPPSVATTALGSRASSGPGTRPLCESARSPAREPIDSLLTPSSAACSPVAEAGRGGACKASSGGTASSAYVARAIDYILRGNATALSNGLMHTGPPNGSGADAYLEAAI